MYDISIGQWHGPVLIFINGFLKVKIKVKRILEISHLCSGHLKPWESSPPLEKVWATFNLKLTINCNLFCFNRPLIWWSSQSIAVQLLPAIELESIFTVSIKVQVLSTERIAGTLWFSLYLELPLKIGNHNICELHLFYKGPNKSLH